MKKSILCLFFGTLLFAQSAEIYVTSPEEARTLRRSHAQLEVAQEQFDAVVRDVADNHKTGATYLEFNKDFTAFSKKTFSTPSYGGMFVTPVVAK